MGAVGGHKHSVHSIRYGRFTHEQVKFSKVREGTGVDSPSTLFVIAMWFALQAACLLGKRSTT
jgi:hypothetical protein